MAKGQHLSRYQQGIVKRYYEHADTRIVTALQELVSDLAVAQTDSSCARLWKKASDALARTGADPKRVASLVAARDLKGLAQLVGELSGSARAVRPDKPAPPRPSPTDDL